MASFSIWHWAIVLIIAGYLWLALLPRMRAAVGGAGELDALSVVPLPRGDIDSQSKAEAMRDALLLRLRKRCDERGIAFTSFESIKGSDRVWLRLEFVQQIPEAPLSLRGALVIEVERHDFHRFENLLKVHLGRGSLRRVVDGYIELGDADIESALDFVVGQRGPLPRLRSRRIRQSLLQLWRPKNKIARIRRDWIKTALWSVGLIALLVLVAGVGGEGAALFNSSDGSGVEALPALVVVLCLGLGEFLSRRRRVHVLNIGRPKSDPLALIRLDSWQTTVNHLGPRHGEVRAEVLKRLGASVPAGVVVAPETVSYASIDGKVEREQIVARFRRAMAFVHLEAYGDELYVAWDSHVNAGIWVEQEAARGIDRPTGKHVLANRVVSGWQRPNEYDLNDASFLTEWIHAGVTAVIRQKVAEHQIDQDIDFTVQRESRSTALRAERSDGEPQKARRFGLGALKRSG